MELLNGDYDISVSIPKTIPKIMADLKGKTIISWLNAPKDIADPEFMKMYLNKDFNLKEMPKQYMQVKAFLLEDTYQVIIIDKIIFHYLVKHLQKELNLPEKDLAFDYNKVFNKTNDLYCGFLDQNLRYSFNKSLSSIRADGTYNKIVDSF